MKQEKRKCSYCGKPVDAPVKKDIYTASGTKTVVYCSEKCAAYAQMSAEG